MKFNFKKIVPILTGAILLGSTIGFAANVAAADVTYPTSFSDAVVVVGAAAMASDTAAANLIANDLGKLSSSTTSTISGESVKIETSSNKLNLGENLTEVRTTAIDHTDLPTLLKSSTFRAKSGEYNYEQKVQLANGLYFTHFKDSSFNANPVIGMKLLSNRAAVMNYTLQFTKNAESSVDTTGHLPDFETKNIEMLGKSYTVLNAYNATGISGSTLSGVKLVLMGGAAVDTLEEKAKKDYIVNGRTYTVEAAAIGQDKVKLIVNGEATDSMVKGDTYKLQDDTQVGVRDFLFNSKTGTVSTVDFSLGAEKLTLQDGQTVQMNDNDQNGLKAYIAAISNGAKVDISTITLEWKTDERAYLTDGNPLTMPGLGAVSIQIIGGLVESAKEAITIDNDGTNAMEVNWPFKDGSYPFDVAYANSTGQFVGYGYDANNQLAISNISSITFAPDSQKYFAVSYKSGTAAESYLLSANTNNPLSTGGQNRTTIRNVITGSDVCVDRTPASGMNTCQVGGSLVLQVNTVDPTNNIVNVSVTSSGSNFDRVYSKEGLTMYLPTTLGASTTKLLFAEADKDHNIDASGARFNVTLTAASDGKVSVSSSAQGTFAGAVGSTDGINSKQLGDSKIFESYLMSKLATKFLYDTNPTQPTLDLEYHGGESYGDVVVSAAGAVAIAGGMVPVKDTELGTSKTTKDLVVVGGPAVNKIAAELLGLTYPTYGSDANSGFAPDTAMIKLFSGTLTPGKIALLVAGYEAADTTAAEKYLVATKTIPTTGTISKTTSASYW